ncbi:hypothetical protein DSM43276_03056 [Mycobacteroides salmoniphilum]|uniref:hypothetical protein n=1 Tax=Mycobacteroides salmoniphilum TaxID=404941 RepID=UPI0010C403A4|nr:hypothetical protein [Mycobacteroides salmoniphilum]QCH24787.1 hypothetical protein DSM43276_03056 [Mycobacteroides salmoniphilum]
MVSEQAESKSVRMVVKRLDGGIRMVGDDADRAAAGIALSDTRAFDAAPAD